MVVVSFLVCFVVVSLRSLYINVKCSDDNSRNKCNAIKVYKNVDSTFSLLCIQMYDNTSLRVLYDDSLSPFPSFRTHYMIR